MARIDDTTNHNSYPDTVTLSGTCTYVYIGDNCTGTVQDCSYCDIGENNTNLSLKTCNYIKIGDNNTDIAISDSDYVIIGTQNRSIMVGAHTANAVTRFGNVTGANSVTVAKDTIGVDITGRYADITDSRYISMDANFNTVKECSSIIMQSCNGCTMDNAKTVDFTAVNNNYVYADNLKFVRQDPYMSYKKYKDVIKAEVMYDSDRYQVAPLGGILDRSANKVINDTPKGNDYVIINGNWEQTV